MSWEEDQKKWKDTTEYRAKTDFAKIEKVPTLEKLNQRLSRSKNANYDNF